jgi:hypothetical protein
MVAANHPSLVRASLASRKSEADKEPLQVRIPVAVKRRFKSHAALRGMAPHQLFVEVWKRYEASLNLKNESGTKDRG